MAVCSVCEFAWLGDAEEVVGSKDEPDEDGTHEHAVEEVEGETEASDPVQPFVREEVAHLRRVHDGEAEELRADVRPGTAHGGVFGEDDAAELLELAGPLGLVGEAVGKGAEVEA